MLDRASAKSAEHAGWHHAAPATGAAAARHLLHHLLHLAELLEEAIDLLDRTTAALRDASATRAVHQLGLLALLLRHGEHDRLQVLHPLRIRILHLLEHLAV